MHHAPMQRVEEGAASSQVLLECPAWTEALRIPGLPGSSSPFCMLPTANPALLQAGRCCPPSRRRPAAAALPGAFLRPPSPCLQPWAVALRGSGQRGAHGLACAAGRRWHWRPSCGAAAVAAARQPWVDHACHLSYGTFTRRRPELRSSRPGRCDGAKPACIAAGRRQRGSSPAQQAARWRTERQIKSRSTEVAAPRGARSMQPPAAGVSQKPVPWAGPHSQR